MLAVRCDACGSKALVAASQCPHCAHPIEIRDTFGELLPLVHCTTCDASYLRSDGACRWCGSTPDKVNYRPYIWKGAGALAFMAMAVGAWLTRDVDEIPIPDSLVSTTAALVGVPTPIVPDETADTTSLRLPDTSVSAVMPDSLTTLASTMPQAVADTSPVSDQAPVAPEPPVSREAPAIPGPTVAEDRAPAIADRPGPAVAPIKAAVRRPPPPARRSARWTTAVVVNWVTVRAAPSGGARLVGSVGPDSHVQLGEARGDWRRIRMRGLAGWVKDGRFAAPRRVASKRRAAP